MLWFVLFCERDLFRPGIVQRTLLLVVDTFAFDSSPVFVTKHPPIVLRDGRVFMALSLPPRALLFVAYPSLKAGLTFLTARLSMLLCDIDPSLSP